jgi:cytochrome c biogenesis protein CcmG, thiol:disulfide interchange protein DsbE
MMFSDFSQKGPLFILLIFFLAYSGCNSRAEIGPLAPDFSLEDLTGEVVTLKQYREQIVLLDFWATWCPPCRQSIPELVNVQRKYGDQGVVILGVSVDDLKEFNNESMLAFKKKFKMNYRILRARPEVIMAYFQGGQMAIPTMFVINREGRVTAKHVGYVPGSIEKSVKKLL